MSRLVCAISGYGAMEACWAQPYIIGRDADDPELPHSCLIGRNPEAVNVLVAGEGVNRVSRQHFTVTVNEDFSFSFTNHSDNGVWLGEKHYFDKAPVLLDPSTAVLCFGGSFEMSFRRKSKYIWTAAVFPIVVKRERGENQSQGDNHLERQLAILAQVRRSVNQNGPAGILSIAPDNHHRTFPTRLPEENEG